MRVVASILDLQLHTVEYGFTPQAEPREVPVVVCLSPSSRSLSLLVSASVRESRPSGPCLLVEITTVPS